MNNIARHVATEMKDKMARTYVKHVMALTVNAKHMKEDLEHLYHQLVSDTVAVTNNICTSLL